MKHLLLAGLLIFLFPSYITSMNSLPKSIPYDWGRATFYRYSHERNEYVEAPSPDGFEGDAKAVRTSSRNNTIFWGTFIGAVVYAIETDNQKELKHREFIKTPKQTGRIYAGAAMGIYALLTINDAMPRMRQPRTYPWGAYGGQHSNDEAAGEVIGGLVIGAGLTVAAIIAKRPTLLSGALTKAQS
jgi:hypothetical protein